MTKQDITIDATNQPLGRLASDLAIKLRGKNKPDFTYHENKGPRIVVENIDKIKLTGQKASAKEYKRYSEYPGGLKTTLAKNMAPAQMLKIAVYGMLPKNRLRAQMIKRLIIK